MEQFTFTKENLEKVQEEITKIFSLPIKDLKVVRTESKTGYFPKILITTGLIRLAPFVPEQFFRHHRRGHQPDPKEYHRRTCARFAQGAVSDIKYRSPDPVEGRCNGGHGFCLGECNV
jgi:hypothetical protein